MPYMPKVRALSSHPATFVCRLNFIEVRGNLGRGEQLFDNFFITNDPTLIKSLVDPRFSGAMGTLEFENILSSPLIAYSKIDNLTDGTENHTIVESLFLLDLFGDLPLKFHPAAIRVSGCCTPCGVG